MASNLDLQSSKCSSCSVLENKSNYWTPTLYYQSPTNGTFYRVCCSSFTHVSYLTLTLMTLPG